MKQVAGQLRLELAQYREVESFAQFGSELDKATQDQIARGRRVIEVLKQGQYQPMHIADQVIQIYAVVNGFLDDIEVEEVQRFEEELLVFMRNTQNALQEELIQKLKIDDELDQKLKQAIVEFKNTFAPSNILNE